MKNEFYNGILYQIEYRPELSSVTYTQKKVYYIYTEEENYCLAHKAIESIMDDGSWRRGIYLIKNKDNPNMVNGLHPYHEFSYDEDKDVFIYTLVIPYDD